MPTEKEVKVETAYWTHVLMHIGVFMIGVAMFCIMLWLIFSKQETKLYEADNVVCASQPLAMECFERKAR